MDFVKAKDIMREDFLEIQQDEPVSNLLSTLKKSKYNNILIFNGEKYTGMASTYSLLRKRVDFSKVKAKSVVESVPTVSTQTDLIRIAQLMHSSGSRLLPVVESNQLLGIVPSQKVIEQIAKIPELASKEAIEFSTKSPISINSNDSISKAITLMRENKVKKLIVLNEQKPVGILSWETLAEKYLLRGSNPERAYQYSMQSHSSDKTESSLDLPVSNELNESFEIAKPDEKLSSIVPKVRTKGGVILLSGSKIKGIITNFNLLESLISLSLETRKIQLSGMPDLDEVDEEKIGFTINSSYDKISKIFGELPLLNVRFKQESVSGLRKKHIINLKANFPKKTLTAEGTDWKLITAVQSAFKKLEKEAREFKPKRVK